jgi:hypothetical protein
VPFKLPLIIAVVFAFTPKVVTLNVAEVWPLGTVTEVGTVAAGVLLDRAIVVPPEPAGPLSVTVPVEGVPP